LQIVEGIATVALGKGLSVIVNNIPVVIAVPALYEVPPTEYLILKSIVDVIETFGNEIPEIKFVEGFELVEEYGKKLLTTQPLPSFKLNSKKK